jgi:polyisoprenoid-binding protein YceI
MIHPTRPTPTHNPARARATALAPALIGAILLLAPLTAAVPAAAAQQAYTIDPDHSEASFQVRHLFTQVRGRFSSFGGTIELDPDNLEASKVDFTIEAGSIDTDNEKRDGHLKSEDFFYVEKHPDITFVSDSIEKTGESTYDVTGTLTMRGVSKRVTLPVELLGIGTDPWGNTRAGFSTETTVDRQEYGINWNQALDQGGYLLGDDVEVQVNIEAIYQAPEEAAAGAAASR